MVISKDRKIMIFLMLVVVLGIFFRGTYLSQKPYWFDESHTLLRSSGYTVQAATQKLFNGQIVQAEDVLRYQHPSAEDRGAGGTIAGFGRCIR